MMKTQIINLVSKILDVNQDDIEIQVPSNVKFGDFSIPCFAFAKVLRMSPKDIAQKLVDNFSLPTVDHTVAINGYFNIFLSKEFLFSEILNKINTSEDYGSSHLGKGKTALIEHTSINPNASPHIGRARNALIGDALTRLLKFEDYKVDIHYFVNDIGKQIAMLVLATEGKDDVKFEELLDLYVQVYNNLKEKPEFEKKVFDLLFELENGNPEVAKKFKHIVDICLKGQVSIFNELGIYYDHFDYESDYIVSGRVKTILEDLKKTGHLFEDETGRLVIDQHDYNIPLENPYLVVTRQDKTSLYPLRDIAYTIDKVKTNSDRNIVVLGEDQKTYFLQIAASLKMLGYVPPEAIHYAFVLLSNGKMSTRQGKVVLLEDFMKESLQKVSDSLLSRYGKIDIEKAKKIAYGSVKYAILKTSSERNVVFDWENVLSFDGDSSLYIQYNYARIMSMLNKQQPSEQIDFSLLTNPTEYELVRKLSEFKDVIEKSVSNLTVNGIASYVYSLTKSFSKYYHDCKIIDEEYPELTNARLYLIKAISKVIKNSFEILGIEVLEQI